MTQIVTTLNLHPTKPKPKKKQKKKPTAAVSVQQNDNQIEIFDKTNNDKKENLPTQSQNRKLSNAKLQAEPNWHVRRC